MVKTRTAFSRAAPFLEMVIAARCHLRGDTEVATAELLRVTDRTVRNWKMHPLWKRALETAASTRRVSQLPVFIHPPGASAEARAARVVPSEAMQLTADEAAREVLELFQKRRRLYYSDIAEELHLDIGTVVAAVEQLEREGLIECARWVEPASGYLSESGFPPVPTVDPDFQHGA